MIDSFFWDYIRVVWVRWLRKLCSLLLLVVVVVVVVWGGVGT